ncbi:MAG: Rpn family recombination-promoting nuclease/putative transposase [Candidatus Rhabdochlamydia sp.]
MEKISPRVDIAFKKIFGVEENKDLLISLINSILAEEDQVTEITLLNPYNPGEFIGDKGSILDIKAKGVDGRRFNIEMQLSDEGAYDKRALYYWGRLYTEQLKIGVGYGTLSKAIGIHILNFNSIPFDDKYHHAFQIKEKETNHVYFEDLELHTIELKKFSGDGNEELKDLLAKIHTSLDMWAAFLTRHDLLSKDKLPEPLNDPSLKKALHVLDVMHFGEHERRQYEDHVKWLSIEADILQRAEDKGIEKGIDKGIKLGEKRGLEKGRKEGKAEGRYEATLSIAQTMANQGVSLDQIAAFTRLSVQEIKDHLDSK